jgi:Protein of unknown function (DUF4238)
VQQHTIPACYLRAWLEPVTPSGQKAAIWRIPVPNQKPGEPYRKSPEKSFRIAERFTVQFEDGTKSYHVERGLSQLEGDYAQVLRHVRQGEQLSVAQRLKLAAFTGAMMGRSKKHSDHIAGQIEGFADRIQRVENASGAVGESVKIRKWAKELSPDLVTGAVEAATPVLFLMETMILRTDDDLGFITSDAPFVLHNPKSHTLPPLYRSPGLLTKNVEIMLPLTPAHLLLYRHGIPSLRYVNATRSVVDEANRYQVWFAGKEIVSWKGQTRAEWFEMRDPPVDAWENTPEGKAIEAARNHREATNQSICGSPKGR